MRRLLIAACLPIVLAFRADRPATTMRVERYANGAIKREAEYVDGTLHGVVKGWYESGAREYVRSYAKGLEEGEHRGWYENGALKFVFRYRDGVSEGAQRQWFASGQLLTSLRHEHGHEVGLQRMWNADGSIRSSYVIKDGKRYGLVGAMGCTGEGRPSALPYYRTAALEPEWLPAADAESPAMHRVAPFAMVDQNNRKVSEQSFSGHVTIVQFFFTTCGDICPTTTRNLARVLATLAGDTSVQVLSYSVAPERDSVAALNEFATRHGITDRRWRLLTGPRPVVADLARRSYFVRLGDGTTYDVATIAHTESVVLIDGDRRVRGIYAGTLRLDMDRLVEDARALAAEQGPSR